MATDAWTVADPCECPECGREACETHLPPTSATERASRATFARATDLMRAARPQPIVEGVAWAGCITVLVSESGTGKTFALLDLCGAVSAGLPWHGRRARPGAVAYLSYEGDALGFRLRAAHHIRGHALEHLYVLRTSYPLSPRTTRDGGESISSGERAIGDELVALAAQLAAAGKPPIGLIIIDTARASMTGSEDNSEHVAAYLRAVRRLMARVPGAAVIIAHHTGWQDGEGARKRERGSSAWRGNGDATLYLEAGEYDTDRGECPLTLRALKVRDAERPAPLHLLRRRVGVDESDEDGRPLTSCVIESDSRTNQDREEEQTTAAETRARADDLRVLRTISQTPELTSSLDRFRIALGVRREVVSGSLKRLIRDGYAQRPERQRRPYTLTAAGRQWLIEAQNEARPTSPDCAPRVRPSE